MFYSVTTGLYQLPLVLFRQKISLYCTAASEEHIRSDCTEFQPCSGLHHETKLNKELLELFFSH